jgi:RHS repeat-associated protein
MNDSRTILTSRRFGFGNLSIRRGLAALLAYLILLQPIAMQAAELHAMRDRFVRHGALHEASTGMFAGEPVEGQATMPAVLPVVNAAEATASQFSLVLTPLETAFNDHSGIAHHQPSGHLLAAAGSSLELIAPDGAHRPFSNLGGLTGDIALATARVTVLNGFTAGEVFTSSNTAGVINRIAADGSSFRAISLAGESGRVTGLHVDGDLYAVTSAGSLWRVTAAGVATRIASIDAELTSITTVPNDAGRYGPLAGKLLAGAAGQPLLYAADLLGNIATVPTGLTAADVTVIPPHQNFYAVDSTSRTLVGAPDDAFGALLGDILIAQSAPGVLARMRWDGSQFEIAQLGTASRLDRVAFSPAGIAPVVAVKRVYEALAVVRHAPELDSGRIEGSLWQLAAENVTLDGTDVITTDLLLPGTPQVVTGSGKPSFGGVIEGTENAQPSTHTFTIANNAVLRHLINRTDPITLTTVAAPPQPTGTRDVSITQDGAPLGDPATLRNLSISGKAGAVALPPGTYGALEATGRTAFVLGAAGVTTTYNVQSLELGGGSELRLAGPVVLNTVTASLTGSTIGAASTPKDLVLQASGDVSAVGKAILYGIVRAPQSTVSIDGGSRVRGTVTADRLRISGNGVLEVVENDVPPPPVNRPPTVDAGGDQTTTLPNDTVTLGGSASDDGLPAGSTVRTQWSAVSGPASVTFGEPANAATTATFAEPGTYVLKLTADDTLLASSDEVTVHVIPRNQAPTVDAGADQTVELPAGASLAGSVSDDGQPAGSTLRTTWSQTGGQGTATFADASSLTSAVTFSAAGSYTLTLSATDGEATVTDSVVITVQPENRPPAADAGDDQFVVLPGAATLSGSASDDGWPAGSTLTTAWVQVSGPSSVAFADPARTTTTATVAVAGVYVLRLTASDGRGSASDDVTVTFDPENQPPAVSAGADQMVELPGRATLTGSVSDDGWPRSSTLTSQWSKVSGPGNVTFADETQPATIASFSDVGTYVLRLTGSDGSASGSDDVTVVVDPFNEPPVVSAGADQAVELPNGASLAGSVDDDGWPRGSVVTSAWTFVSGPGVVTFADVTKPATIATFETPGTYVFRLTATDGRESVSDEATVVVYPQNQPPTVSAGPDQQLRLPAGANLAGTAADDGWPFGSTLVATWTMVSGPGTVTFSAENVPATTATFSTDGTYVLRLTATDSRETVYDEVTVVVLPANIAPTVDAGEPQSATLDRNLLANGGNEEPLVDNSIANWIAVSGIWSRGGSFPVSAEGEQLFATDAETAELSQDVDIRAFAAGQTFAFEGFVRTGDEAAFDAPRVVVEYRDATQTLASFDFTPDAALTSWTRIADTRAAPAGTTTIRVRLIATRNSGAATDAWFDGFSLRAVGAAAVVLAGSVSDDGLPSGSTLITEWTKVSGPGSVTFGDAADAATSAAFTAAGTYVLRLTANDGEFTIGDDVEITVGHANAPPAVDAGPRQEIRLPDFATLHGTVVDSDSPDVTVAWSAIVAGAPVVFSSPDAAETTATFTAPGTYVLRLTANDTVSTIHDEVIVVVKPANRTPQVDAGLDQSLTLPATASLNGTAFDPEANSLNILWTEVSGPGSVTFSAPASPVTEAAFSTAGTYVLRLTADDGELSASDEVTVMVAAEPVNEAPVADAGADVIAQVGDDVALNGSATDDGLPRPATLTVAWSVVSGTGTATFADPAAAATTVTFDKPGVYVLRLTASDTLLTAADDVRITVRSAPVAAFSVAGPSRTVLMVENNLALSISGGQIAGVSSVNGSYPGENAIDPDMSTRWRANAATNQWFIVQLGGTENGPRSFDRIRFLNGMSSEAIRNFRIDVSTTTTDDAAFTTVLTGVAGNAERMQEFRLSAPVAARYVRLFAVDTHFATGVASVRSFQVITPRMTGIPTYLAGPNVAIPTEGAVAIAQTAGSGTGALDGRLDTFWSTSSTRLTNQSFTIDLNTQHTLDRIRLYNLDDSTAPIQRAVKEFRFEVSNDNVTFTTAFSGVALNASGAQEFTFAPVTARYVRFFAVNNYGSTIALGLRELEVVSVYARQTSVSSYHSASALPENLFDTDAATAWLTGSGRFTNEYVEVEVGPDAPGPVVALGLQSYVGTTTESLKDFELLASTTTDDDSAFTSILTGTALNNGLLQTFTFPGGPVHARYFRLLAKNNYGSTSYIRLGTLQLLAPSSEGNLLSAPATSVPAQPKNGSPAMLANGATVVALSSGAPNQMLDYAYGAPWSTNVVANQFVKIQLAAPQVISGVVLAPRVDTSATADSVKDFEIWVSSTTSDDAAFTKVLTAAMTAAKVYQTFTFDPVEAKFIKYVPKTPQGTSTTLATSYFDVVLPQPAEGIYGGSTMQSARFNPQQALDGISSTGWLSANNAPADQYLDLALPASRRIYGITITPDASHFPKDFQVRVSTTSTDPAAFTTIYTGTLAQTSAVQQVLFDRMAEARYVRIHFVNSWSATNTGVRELSLLMAPDNGAAMISWSSNSSSSFPSTQLITDVDTVNGQWTSATNAVTNQFLTMALPGTQSWVIDHVAVQSRADYPWQYGPRQIVLEVANDAEAMAWKAVWSGTYRATENRLQHLWFPAVQARYVRLRILNNWGVSQVVLQNFLVYSSQIGALSARFIDRSLPGDSGIESWQWNFGDGGTSSERDPEHTYAEPGLYDVQLSVTDANGLTGTRTIPYLVEGAPRADFTAAPQPGLEGSTVVFTDTSSAAFGTIGTREWVWGDTQPNGLLGSTFGHIYQDNGTYSATLRVTSSRGVRGTVTKNVTILNVAPAAIANDKTTPWGQDWANSLVADDVGLTDRATLFCQVDFGDGTTRQLTNCRGAYIEKTYSDPGVYTVRFTVTDKDGGTTTDTAAITVAKRATTISYSGGRGVTPGEPITVGATLRDAAQHTLLPGRTVTFTMEGQTATAVTDAEGFAEASIVYNGTSAQPTIVAAFAGDNRYTGSSISVVAACPAEQQPLDISLVFDLSGSMLGERLTAARNASMVFLDSLQRNQDQAAAVSFTSNGQVHQALTYDLDAVRHAIDTMNANGGTLVASGINTARTELLSARRNPFAIPVMIVYSDFEDGDETQTRAAATTAKNAGIRIISVMIGGYIAARQLGKDVASSPGDYYEATQTGELTGIYASIVGSLCVPANKPPVVDSGANQTITFPANSVTLAGSVTDDGLPPLAKLQISWSKESGPGTVTFGDATKPATTASFSVPGTYLLRLTANDTQYIRSSSVTITVRPENHGPAVNAGPDQTLALPSAPAVPPFALKTISTNFSSPIGIDHHVPTNKVVISANYDRSGQPWNFELLATDGTHAKFSTVSGLTDELKIATARDDGNGMSRGGFPAGTLFAGTGAPGAILRVSPDGTSVQSPWVTLPGESGLMRGGLYIDRTGIFNGDLIVCTTAGGVWRISSAGVATRLATVGEHLEGLSVLPNLPEKYGPWAGKIVAGAENSGRFWTVAPNGTTASYSLGITPEDIDIIPSNENFFGVDYGGSRIWGAPAAMFAEMAGDVLVAQELPGILWHVRWNGTAFEKRELARVTQWEHVTFSPAAIVEVPQPATTTVTLNGTATDDGNPPGSTLAVEWTTVNAPGTVTFASRTQPVTTATLSEAGTYVLRLTANDSELSAADDVTIVVKPGNRGPKVDAGPNQTTTLRGGNLAGTVTDDGLPDGTLTYSWAKLNGPGNVTFGDTSSLTTTASYSAFGTYTLRLTATDGEFTVSDDVTVIVDKTPGNAAPSVNAGSDVTLTDPVQSTTLNGAVTDDGIPSGATISRTWSQVSGPAAAMFADESSASTSVTFNAYGVYVLRLTASDTELTSSDDVVITYRKTPDNVAPAVDAGADATINTSTATLAGTATDDGLPIGSTVSVAWSKVSGPGNVTFGNAASRNTTASFSVYGVYVLRLTASDGELAASDTVTIRYEGVNQAPAVNAGADRVAVVSKPATLSGAVTDDNLPLDASVTVQWTKVSGPGTVTFGNAALPSTTAVFSDLGTYVLRLTASDSALSASDDVTVTVQQTAPAPTVDITSPDDGSTVMKPTVISGTVSGGTWRLEVALRLAAREQEVWTTIGSGSGAKSGALGTFDPTLRENGTWAVRLVSVDEYEQTSSSVITVLVDGQLKLGHFTVTFADVKVASPALPVEILRTYDTRNQHVGDFGFGWTIAMRHMRVQKNTLLGDGWEQVSSSGSFPTYTIAPTRPHYVTVTLLDGRVYKFRLTLAPSSQRLAPLSETTISYVQEQALRGTEGASLVSVDADPTVYLYGSVPGPTQLFDYETVDAYDPEVFRLTTAAGYKYTIDVTKGVTDVEDPLGNTLAIRDGSITSSNGKGVTIVRDALKRITHITDAGGKSIVYAYDGRGDLVSVTNRENQVTRHTYDATHRLLSIIGPDGKELLGNEYDAQGRLIGQSDASGDSRTIDHDADARKTVVHDRLGNPATLEYDDRGNLLRETDALGNVTARTYDEVGNVLTVTNPLGHTTSFTYDARGNTLTEKNALDQASTYTYNARGDLLTSKDPLGRTTTNNYDAGGRLLSATDPAGNTTTITYASKGLIATTSDALNRATSYGYDAAGNVTRITDPLSNVINATYDPNGNVLTESTTRTTPAGPVTDTVSYVYDNEGRITKTTFPDGATTETVYTATGLVAKTIDELGLETVFEYDDQGRLTKTTYPDTKFESTTYDPEGRRLTVTDRGGRITRFQYDEIGRLLKTTYADGTAVTVAYDKASRPLTYTDPNGNVTTFEYDTAGRRTKTTDSTGRTASAEYNAAGAVIAVVDARNNRTGYDYDAMGRRTKTLLPDGTSVEQAYDEMGQLISRTDQMRRKTQFEYDKRGRLTRVTDPLGNSTSYTYDERGNRLTQSDANGHVTRFEYDPSGKLTRRTLPLGMSERYTYDIAGQLKTRVDFNGRTTTYGYDAMGRLLSKTPDASFGAVPVIFTYTPTGKRATMSAANGVTTYGYDTHDRLASKASPAGTLTWTYDGPGRLSGVSSNHQDGLSVAYEYDALGHLAAVVDSHTGRTTYGYDAAGNMKTRALPNGVTATHTYDSVNRLSALTVSGSAPLATYDYVRDAVGRRTSVTELGGRTTTWAYDELGRLTSETIAADPAGLNGSIAYTFDKVSNRLTRTSTVVGLADQSFTYDDNDRPDGTAYDANGAATELDGVVNRYDFEDHLLGRGNVSVTYDGDGMRASKTVSGVTTAYLTNELSPTGYVEVVEELIDGTLNKVYTHGLDLISQRIVPAGQISYYGFDGQGNVRFLTDTAGAITDTYTYDAFGNLLFSTGSTPNDYRYRGQQHDPDLDLYYNRARYLHTDTGRFISQDPYAGMLEDPVSLHRYLYANGDGVNFSDPTGMWSLGELNASMVINTILGGINTMLTNMIVGGILGGITGALDDGDVLGGAKTGALLGAALSPLGALAKTSAVLMWIFRLAGLGAGGYSAYDAWRRGKKGLAVFHAILTIGAPFVEYLHYRSARGAGTGGGTGGGAGDDMVGGGGGGRGGAPDSPPVLPANNKDYVVIGSRDDTLAAEGWPGHDVLNVPDHLYSEDLNWDWVNAAIARRAIVYLATNPTGRAMTNAKGGRSIFSIEYSMFLKAGYQPAGDFLLPPIPKTW